MGGSVSLFGGLRKPQNCTDVDLNTSIVTAEPTSEALTNNRTEIQFGLASEETEIAHGIRVSTVDSTIIGDSPIPLSSSRHEEGVTLAIAMTPRSEQQNNLSQQDITCVPYTPHGDEAAVFKYYCPLCMQYFRDIMKMKCCGNYICVECCKDYIQTKHVDLSGLTSIGTIEEIFITSNTILCPHCQVNGFHPMSVSFEELIRDYSTRVVPAQGQHSHSSGRPGFSPLRVGESFEDLKRKMIPYKSASSSAVVVLSTEENRIESTLHTTAAEEEEEEGEVCEYIPNSSFRYSSTSIAGVGGAGGEGGIAMSYYGDSTPISRSPRMRLEPDTPELQPLYAQQQHLFTEDTSILATNSMEEKSSEHSFPRILALSVPVSHCDDAHIVHTSNLSSPNEIRLGSPSPRLETLNGSAQQYNSRSLRISPRTSTPATSTGILCMNAYASGVVEELLRAAVTNSSTQHSSSTLCAAQQ